MTVSNGMTSTISDYNLW